MPRGEFRRAANYIKFFLQVVHVLRLFFERFYKVDNFTQGAGLGLSICQTIVERLKGTISVTSEVGKGTRFTVRLPNYCE